MITVTERAAEEVKRILEEQKVNAYLRVRILGGGCSGFTHKLDIDENFNEKLDDVFEAHGIKIVVDKRSKIYLEGSTVDFIEEINRRGFTVDVAGASGRCGCGSSFSF